MSQMLILVASFLLLLYAVLTSSYQVYPFGVFNISNLYTMKLSSVCLQNRRIDKHEFF